MSKLEAALLLCHVRSTYLKKTLAKLEEFGINRIYVAIDGPRNELDSQQQKELFSIIDSVSSRFSVLKVKTNAENLGLGVAIISALDWFFGIENKGVVIEDDLEFDLDFLHFIEAGLNQYEDDENTWMICGSRLIPERLKSRKLEGKVLISNYPIIWGWGSWADRWPEMLNSILKLPKPIGGIPLNVQRFWKVGHKRVARGTVDTWDIPLAASMRLAGIKGLIPPVNLVSNVGFDEFASNEMRPGFPLGIKIERWPQNSTQKVGVNLCEFSNLELEEVNSIFEKEVFGIKFRHRFIEIYSVVIDYFRRIKERRPPLLERLISADSKFKKYSS